MTNEEKIKAMSREDLAKFLCGLMCAECCESRCPAARGCKSLDNGMSRWLSMESGD